MFHTITLLRNNITLTFPHYRYDDEEKVVKTFHYKKRNELTIETLKWLTLTNGKSTYKRVTLFEKGNPHFFSEKQILKMIEGSEGERQVIYVASEEEAARMNRIKQRQAAKKAKLTEKKSRPAKGKKQNLGDVLATKLEETIEKMEEKDASKNELESRFQEVMEEKKDLALQQQIGEMIVFFNDRNNKPARRDVFITKFGKTFTEEVITQKLVTTIQHNGKTFYFLAF